jgi:uncharacterized protein with HEPN domain
MRNRLIHTYNEISLDTVWAVVQDDLRYLFTRVSG